MDEIGREWDLNYRQGAIGEELPRDIVLLSAFFRMKPEGLSLKLAVRCWPLGVLNHCLFLTVGLFVICCFKHF